MTRTRFRAIVLVLLMIASTVAARAAARDSERLGRAKDFIADEQWQRAVAELRLAIADPKEKSKDEALYWLAHSLNQAGDAAASVETIRRLEREYPRSVWVKPAGSLRLEIALHLRRDDVLWWTAAAPYIKAPAVPATPEPPAPPAAAPRPPRPPKGAPPNTVAVPAASAPVAVPPAMAPPAPPLPPAPPVAWFPESYEPDMDLRIQALGILIKTDAERVVPMLKSIALGSTNSMEARRAIFVLAQSGKTLARETVLQVAKTGPELVRIAAVRELGRFGGPGVSQELLQVYATGDDPVKLQVVTSLGDRSERVALLHIAESEKDPHLRDRAIVTLGQAGGGEQLGLLYRRAKTQAKRPIIVGLFSARAEDELIRIAQEEPDGELRMEAIRRLQLMGTPKAKEYLRKAGQIR
jgi:hypothetical protein